MLNNGEKHKWVDDPLEEITPAELALRWNMSAGTLAVWRCMEKGPPYLKRGKIAYIWGEAQEWDKKRKVIPEDK